MKKKILIAVLLVFGISTFLIVNNQDSKTERLRKKYANYLKNSPFNKTLALTEEEREENGIPPNKYFEEQYLLEMDPNTGTTHPENYLRVQKELKAERKAQRVPGDANDNKWVERGPNNVGGRTRVVLYDPNDATHKRVFAGGVSGGLWVNNDITDANSSWTRVGIDENLSVSCITVDPNNSQIMYVGTGESYTGDQAVGNGVWKSTDGGNSWVNVFNDNFNSDVTKRLFYINDIKAWNDPFTNKTVVFIGVGGAYYGEGEAWVGYAKQGLYKSTDNGSSWSKITLPSISGTSTGYEPNDIEIGADNALWIGTESSSYGFGGGTILKSNNGNTFTVAHTYPNAKRTEIAVSKTDKDKIYALYHISGAPKMEVTTDGFINTANTTAITLPNDADTGISANDFTRGQSWYDLMVEVDPTNDDIVYIGGIDLFQSTNNGTAWSQISKWSNNNNLATTNVALVHADQHAMAFNPTDPTKAVFGNDGGIFYASDLTTVASSSDKINSRNKDYNVTQFYHGNIGQSTTNVLLIAGAQDNGTPFIENATSGVNNSYDVYGGDGAYSHIDDTDASKKYIIAAYTYNTIAQFFLPFDKTYKSGSWRYIQQDQKTGSFINPTVLDENIDVLYTNGIDGATSQLFRFKGLNQSVITPIKETMSNALLTANVTALSVSPYTINQTNLFVGTSDGKVLKITAADGNSAVWTDITGGSFLGSVSDIAFGANENEILVAFHNYGVTSVWFTKDGGSTWLNKEGNFPDIPVKAIMMNPLNNDEVIIGTQLGVWRTGNFKDASPSWTQSYNGMSNVKVTSFSLRTADNTVLATTYGRGMFTGKFFPAPTASVDDVVKGNKVFTMYPTISNGDFTIFAKNTLGKASLLLFDINGKQVFSKQVDFTQQEKQPVSVNLSAGVYIVNLIDKNNKKATGKVIIK